MNGNDIVDLHLAQMPSGMRKARFLDKIFSPYEKECVLNGLVGLWSIWAVKEAVYKAHQRRFQLPRVFDPKGIKVHIRETSANLIWADAEYLGYNYLANGNITSNYVHVIATALRQKIFSKEFQNISTLNIKIRLKQSVAQNLGLEIELLDIVKDENLIPQIRYKNVNLNLPFSISHHGEFGAFSYQLINY